jgi:hypothetical protein
VPIGFCFGLATLSYLAFATTTPLTVVVSRMDEGMSSIILVSVPVFVLLGCVLDSTGMGKAIVDVLASLLGHVRAGMSYVLLGSLFIVSGISGSKVSRHGHRGAGAVPRDEAPRPQAARDDRAAGHRRGHGRHGAAVDRADRAGLGGGCPSPACSRAASSLPWCCWRRCWCWRAGRPGTR